PQLAGGSRRAPASGAALQSAQPGLAGAVHAGRAGAAARVVDVQPADGGAPRGGGVSSPATAVQARGPVGVPSRTPAGWIANASYDGWFFVGSLALCAVLVAIALVRPALAIPATIVAGVLFANTHNLLTGFFFLDAENLAYYRRYPHYYFTAPLVLLGLSMAIFVWWPPLAFTLHFFFTTWHVVRQSVGIQKLYLGKVKATDFDRNLDATLIYAAVVALHLFAIWKFQPLWATKALAPGAVVSGGAG